MRERLKITFGAGLQTALSLDRQIPDRQFDEPDLALKCRSISHLLRTQAKHHIVAELLQDKPQTTKTSLMRGLYAIDLFERFWLRR